MPKYKTECFGQFVYAPEVSYDELLQLEDNVKKFTTATLEIHGAEFLAFESEGDRTFFQCVMQECGQELAESVAAAIKRQLNKQLECKVLFVDKMLCAHHFCTLTHKSAKLQTINLPAAGPLDKALLAEGA